LSILSFANDTTVYMSLQNLNELYNTANQELVKLNDWFCANKLALNVKKTKYAVFGTQHQSNQIPNEPTLSINNLKLTQNLQPSSRRFC